MFALAEFVWTYQVDTQRMPGNDLWFWLGWNAAVFLTLGLEAFADSACSTHLPHRVTQTLPVIVLAYRKLHSGFTRVEKVRVVPFCCLLLKVFR